MNQLRISNLLPELVDSLPSYLLDEQTRQAENRAQFSQTETEYALAAAGLRCVRGSTLWRRNNITEVPEAVELLTGLSLHYDLEGYQRTGLPIYLGPSPSITSSNDYISSGLWMPEQETYDLRNLPYAPLPNIPLPIPIATRDLAKHFRAHLQTSLPISERMEPSADGPAE